MSRNTRKTGFARRRDDNEPAIVEALVSVGASVTRLNETGVPDLLVGFEHPLEQPNAIRVTVLMEVKQPKKGLTPDQVKWFDRWTGDPPVRVETPEDALIAIGLRIGPPGMWHYCPFMSCDGVRGDCIAVRMHRMGTYPRSTK